MSQSKIAIVIHGGAGTITRAEMTAEKEAEIRKAVEAEYEKKFKAATSLPPSGAGGSLGADNLVVDNESLSDILGEKTD